MIILKKKENWGGGNNHKERLRKMKTENNRNREQPLTYDYIE